MKSLLSENLINLAKSCPYPLYVVGGRCRDFLAGLTCEKPDNDICAPADADDFIERAKSAGFGIDAVYKNTGTVKLSCGGEDYEFTCFRSDEYVRGTHRPVRTFFTDDITLDAKRRDFKCNAVYYDIVGGQFVDPLGGIEDIKAKRMTTVDDALKVFGEDGLRLMRLARIAAQTGFTPDEECINGAREKAILIEDVARERVYAELDAILHAEEKYGAGNAVYRGLDILRKTWVIGFILNYLAAGDGMEQRADYHKYDVLEHSIRAAAYADKRVRLAALLHDAGKPYCMHRFGNFHEHDYWGSLIAEDTCRLLYVPKKLTERVEKLVSLHMYDFDCKARENKVRKFIVENYEYFDDLMLLKQADYSACRDDFSPAPTVVKMKGIYEKMKAENIPFTVKELDVRGDELIAAGCPKELTAQCLKGLLLRCAVKTVENEKDKLVNYAVKVAFRF